MTVTHDYEYNPNFFDGVIKLYMDSLSGDKLIGAERRRQIEKEGWSAEHDDLHVKDELSLAAMCYIFTALRHSTIHDDSENMRSWIDELPLAWPWAVEWFKPKGKIGSLIKAGALIAAEIDRLKRLENGSKST